MKVVSMCDYFIDLAEEICIQKFENDIMLVFNNFSERAVILTIDKIKSDIYALSKMGVVFNNDLIKVLCSMYLGLSWSMYRKGKMLQSQKRLCQEIISEIDYTSHSKLVEYIHNKENYVNLINNIAVRYFTLYFSKHIKDVFFRMDIVSHPDIKNEKQLKDILINHLNDFGITVISMGILDEYRKENWKF